MSGGFLSDQGIHLGPNLNCIIGGRGTGKSTTFEAIRCLTGQPGGASVVDLNVWPDQIDLLFEDQAGQLHHLSPVRAAGRSTTPTTPFRDRSRFRSNVMARVKLSRSANALRPIRRRCSILDRSVDVRDDLTYERALRDELSRPVQNRGCGAACRADPTISAQSGSHAVANSGGRKSQCQGNYCPASQDRAGAPDPQHYCPGDADNRRVVSQQAVKEAVEGLKTAADPDVLVVGPAEFRRLSPKQVPSKATWRVPMGR